MTSCIPDERFGPPWTRYSTRAGRPASNYACLSIAVGANSRSRPAMSDAWCRPPRTRSSKSSFRRSTIWRRCSWSRRFSLRARPNTAMNWTVQQKIRLGFWLLTFVPVVLGVLAARNAYDLADASRHVAVTNESAGVWKSFFPKSKISKLRSANSSSLEVRTATDHYENSRLAST